MSGERLPRLPNLSPSGGRSPRHRRGRSDAAHLSGRLSGRSGRHRRRTVARQTVRKPSEPVTVPNPSGANGCGEIGNGCRLSGGEIAADRAAARLSANLSPSGGRPCAPIRTADRPAADRRRRRTGTPQAARRDRDGREPVRHGRTQWRAVAARFRRNVAGVGRTVAPVGGRLPVRFVYGGYIAARSGRKPERGRGRPCEPVTVPNPSGRSDAARSPRAQAARLSGGEIAADRTRRTVATVAHLSGGAADRDGREPVRQTETPRRAVAALFPARLSGKPSGRSPQTAHRNATGGAARSGRARTRPAD